MNNEFEVVAVDLELAKLSARIRSKYRVPLADSVIARTAQLNGSSASATTLICARSGRAGPAGSIRVRASGGAEGFSVPRPVNKPPVYASHTSLRSHRPTGLIPVPRT